MPFLSQAGGTFGTDYLSGDPGEGSGQEEEEEEDSNDNGKGEEDDEEEKEEDSSHPQKKSMEVKIQGSKRGKGLYFLMRRSTGRKHPRRNGPGSRTVICSRARGTYTSPRSFPRRVQPRGGSFRLVWQLLAAVFGTGKSGVNGPI